jgi:carboxylesterase
MRAFSHLGMWRASDCRRAAKLLLRRMAGRADPFVLGDGPDACLLLHGLTGSPAEMRPVGEALAAAGFRAVGPLLPGHGTTPEDLDTTTRADLIQAAESAFLSLQGARRVFLCGLSVGGLLAIHLAARSWLREGLPDLSALALLAPAIEFAGATWLFANVVGRLPALPVILNKGARDLAGGGSRRGSPVPSAGGEPDEREKVDGSYTAIPMRWGAELRALSQEAQKLARRVRAPALMLHGALDRTIAPSGSRKLARLLASAPVDLRVLPHSGHVLPLDAESAEVCRSIVSFFQGVV